MARLKRVRVIKKVRDEAVWRYVSLKQTGNRYVWDDRRERIIWNGGKARNGAARPLAKRPAK